MTATVALAGDTMLGRGVANVLRADPTARLLGEEVSAQIARADAFVLNLECCISDRGARFPDPVKPFFFRAPPVAAQRLAAMGVDAVTLANNHALDYGTDALLDTLAHLEAVGITTVGAGTNEALARQPRTIRCGELRVRLVAFSDHPHSYAAGPQRPGIAFADLRSGLPDWLREGLRAPDAQVALVSPHWGPNMVPEPVRRVRETADWLLEAGATAVAGHSAHVFHGVADRVLFDLGDFLDDYAVDPELRNDLGLLWLVELDADGPHRIRALPLALDYCFTDVAPPAQVESIVQRLRDRCKPFGTVVEPADGLIEVRPRTT
jgi:poly-gamma-glutamate capsule biosynthesis protein CapA/YwtB (metallophosphatase superfamily)